MVTDQPIKSVLERPETLGNLGEHKITYVPRKVVKAQILADFIVEISKNDTTEINEVITDIEPSNLEARKLFTDGASSIEGSGAGLVLIDPEGF